MTIDFNALRKQVAKDNHLSTDYFGETVTFYPVGRGSPREVTGHIANDQQANIDQGNEETVEQIVFTCLRDEADPDCGGIESIRVGAGIVRDPASDPNPLRYVFAGEIRELQPFKWKLVFVRHLDSSQGNRRSR